MSSEHAFLTFQGGCPNHRFWSNEGREKKWEKNDVLSCINKQELKSTHPITEWEWILFPSPCLTEHLQFLYTLAMPTREHFGILLCPDRPSPQSSGIWISFLSTRSFLCYELLSYVATFLCYELVLWILGENKTIITNFSSPLNSPIHFLCFSYMDEIFSLRLMFICSWQTLSVFPLGEINQKIWFCLSSIFFFQFGHWTEKWLTKIALD